MKEKLKNLEHPFAVAQHVKMSKNHWKRMIVWVETQPSNNNTCRAQMYENINEWWGGDSCMLCAHYRQNLCMLCPLKLVAKKCNDFLSIWWKVNDSKTWGVWLSYAAEMYNVLEQIEKALTEIISTRA